MNKYEIWIGNYHLGQGHHGSIQSQKVDEIEATSFKIACFLHELKSTTASINKRMLNKFDNVEDIHFGYIYYNPKLNSNSWTGKYYETKEEADKSFK